MQSAANLREVARQLADPPKMSAQHARRHPRHQRKEREPGRVKRFGAVEVGTHANQLSQTVY